MSSKITYTLGTFPTIELLVHQPQHVVRVFLHSKLTDPAIKELCQKHNIPTEVNDSHIQKISKAGNCYALGVFNPYATQLDPSANHLVLVNPDDMGNLGTIIRTMVGFDMHNLAIILPAANIFDPKVIRASMGALFQINFSYFTSFSEYQSKFSRNFYPFMLSAKKSLEDIKFVSPYSLIMGPEGSGLSSEFNHIGTSVNIPQSDHIDSLNLSVATSIALYNAYKTT